MAAPLIGLQILYHASSQGIAVNVLQHLQEIRVRFHEDRPVAPSKQGTIATVRPIVTLRINAISVKRRPLLLDPFSRKEEVDIYES